METTRPGDAFGEYLQVAGLGQYGKTMLKQVGELTKRQHYVQALAVIRLVAGLVAGVGLMLAILLFEPVARARWSIGLLLLLTAVNVVMVWQSSRSRIDRWLLPVALLDTLLILTLVDWTGGIASPLVLLLLFPIGQVAISASPAAAYWVAGFCAIAYSSLLFRPFGLVGGTLPMVSAFTAHLTVFNVVVSDVCFIAFAIAAGQTGQALREQEGRLLSRSSRLRREVRTLARLARTAARETDLPLILGDVLETAATELGVDRAGVIALEPGSGNPGVLAWRAFPRGREADLSSEESAAIVHGPLVQAALQRHGTVTAQREFRRLRIGSGAPPVALGAAVAALLVGDSCIGCLYVDAGSRPYRWTDETLLLLEAFADLTAVALDNTRLYSDVLAEKSKLEATMGAVIDALLIYEPGGQVLLANTPFRTIFDVSPHAAGLTIDGLRTYAVERQRLGLSVATLPSDELFDASDAEFEIGAPARLLQRRGKVVHDENGQVLATVLTFHDMTEEQQAERLREEILATVSHELRTPLTSIKGFVQIFDRRQQKGETVASAHELDLVQRQVDRLMSLVDDLLDVSNLPGRHMRLSRVDMDLADLARERIARVQRESGRSITLDVQATQVAGFWDGQKIGQVLDNLLTNAVTYSDADSHIGVVLVNRPGVVRLMVRDEGMGVAPEHLAHVFDAFFRVDNTTTRRTNGLGIGLYLCKRIVEEHSGQMHVHSEPGIGSEFGFSLPVVRQWEPLHVRPVTTADSTRLPALRDQ